MDDHFRRGKVPRLGLRHRLKIALLPQLALILIVRLELVPLEPLPP